ncbi:MAG: hypothetical protein ACXWFI_04420 [Methylobacter sp.]
MLNKAGLFDFGSVPTPGAFVALPGGMFLLQKFSSLIQDAFERVGLSEHRFPVLLPNELLEPTAELFSLDKKILRVSSVGQPSLSQNYLAPTGESVVYSWLSRRIEKKEDLPIELYQRTTYFRPLRSGGGLSFFRSSEAGDVFEFHGVYADQETQRINLARFSVMLDDIFRQLGLPVIWSIRPPWTNNRGVATAVRAADLLLPNGKTIQLSALYDQNERFSKPYKISYRDGDATRHTSQLAGYVSRRALMALLWWSSSHRQLALPPSWAPLQVGVTTRKGTTQEKTAAAQLVSALKSRGLRAAMDERPLGTARRRLHERGVPLDIVVREEQSRVRFVLTRESLNLETEPRLPGIDTATDATIAALALIEQDERRQLAFNTAARQTLVTTPDEVNEITAKGGVALLPLSVSEQAVRAVEQISKGEVLGFVEDRTPLACSHSQAPVRTRVVIARRV